MSSINDIILTRDKLVELRNRINTLKNSLNAHIGETGSIHPIATSEQSGFMSTTQYNNYLTYITKDDGSDSTELARLKTLAASSTVPSGTTLWYYGDPNSLPDDWEITSSANPLGALVTQTNGGELRGTSTESEAVGTVETNTATRSIPPASASIKRPLITTLSLYSIRKK